ncbi:O-antigen ligase family protein [Amylibacter sp.]|nr:O-antigen ligase family protein [Amylibacter sp.]
MLKQDKSNIIIWFLLVLAFATMMRLVSSVTADLSFVILAGYALCGRSEAIQALFLSWLFTMLSEGVAPALAFGAFGRYIVIFAAAVSIFLRGGWLRHTSRGSNLVRVTSLLGVLLLLHSLLFSSIVDVSILKSISFLVVIITLLAAWENLSPGERQRTERFVFGGLIAVLLFSLPLIMTGLGYLRNGTGFQGVLNQPQAFGPTAALVGAMVGGRLLETPRPRRLDLALFVMCLVLTVLSEARTAGLAMIFGIFGVIVLLPIFSGMPRRKMLPGLRSRRLKFMAFIFLLCTIIFAPVLSNTLQGYLFKRSDTTSLIEAAEISRGVLLLRMVKNIQENPWTGIGFGVASDPRTMVVSRDPILGIPYSAPIEKGVLPIAIVEEMGAIGAFVFFAWLLVALRRSAHVGANKFAIMLTLLLVNLGEYMLFSVGGMGMLLLILLTGAVSTKKQNRVTNSV